MMQNENLHIALDLTQEWADTQEEGGSSLVTGVTITTADFLADHEDVVTDFLAEHELSAAYTNENPAEASAKIEELEIVAKAAVAEKAIPYCNITCIEGTEMEEALSGYLEVLYDLDPTSVGGSLPAEDFYYIAE
jgi:NitT/TauT family transport system substrate-binding protein